MVANLRKLLFSSALAAVMAMGLFHLTASPAQALNCSLYERPNCYWVGWIEGCCYFEGSGCGPQGYRIGPCMQLP